MTRPALAALAAAAFLATIVAANVATTHLGLVPLGLGLAVTAGTFAAGAALVARDAVQEFGGLAVALLAILAGTVLSAVFGDGRIAAASALAFGLSELLDLLVYTPLKESGRPAAAVLMSSCVAAPVDTVLFLWVAGFPLTWQAVVGQWLVKVALAALAAAALAGVRRRRAVPRESVDAARA